MPITSLNKIISSFLVGVLGTALAIFPFHADILAYLSANQAITTPAGAVVIGFLLLAVSGLSGSIIDSVADVSIRNAIVRIAERRIVWTRFFFQGRVREKLNYWEATFGMLCKEMPQYHRLLASDTEENRKAAIRQLGIAIFHAKTSKEYFEWVSSHYALYYMATNFVVLLGFGLAIAYGNAALIGAWVLMKISIGVFVVCYLLISLAIDRYIYTNLATFRFACLYITESRGALGS